jgi:hypothetical protein
MSAATVRPRPDSANFAVDDGVVAQWPDGEKGAWHDAKVERCNPDGTYALSYPALVRLHPAVPESSIRSKAESSAVKAGHECRSAQCCSIALDLISAHPSAQAPLSELCLALRASSDMRAEVDALLLALGVETLAGVTAPPPPPPPRTSVNGAAVAGGRPQPPTSPSAGGAAPAATTTPGTPGTGEEAGGVAEEPEKEVGFLGDARSLSKLAPNLAAAQKLRTQLAGVVTSSHTVTSPRRTAAAAAAAAGGLGGASVAPAPSSLLATTFFMPSFADADEGFREFITSRLVYKYGHRDLESRGIINWAVERSRLDEDSRLQPLWTLSDGNCLLHASLLGIWGLHDYGKVDGLCSLRAVSERGGPPSHQLPARPASSLSPLPLARSRGLPIVLAACI